MTGWPVIKIVFDNVLINREHSVGFCSAPDVHLSTPNCPQ